MLVTLTLGALEGIDESFAHDVQVALSTCSNRERLAVCLYFMSELSDDSRHHKDIEKNLRQIFPPSVQGNTPDSYVDFQATAIRSVLNAETAANPPQRTWESRGRGNWRNTDYGNEYALQVLRRQGVIIRLRGRVVH